MTPPTAPVLEARSVPQMIDALFGLARRHAWDLFALGVLFHLPVHVFRITEAFDGLAPTLTRWSPEAQLGSAWWYLWNDLAVAATAVAATQAYTEGTTNIRRALVTVRTNAWRLFGTIAAIEIWTAGLMAPYLQSGGSSGALYLWVFAISLVWLAPAIPATAAEHLAPWTAIRRSLWLVRGNFWRTAAAIGLVFLPTYLADHWIMLTVFSLTHQRAVAAISDLAVDGVLYPLRGIILAIVYVDCRVRREGYDVERLLRAS